MTIRETLGQNARHHNGSSTQLLSPAMNSEGLLPYEYGSIADDEPRTSVLDQHNEEEQLLKNTGTDEGFDPIKHNAEMAALRRKTTGRACCFVLCWLLFVILVCAMSGVHATNFRYPDGTTVLASFPVDYDSAALIGDTLLEIVNVCFTVPAIVWLAVFGTYYVFFTRSSDETKPTTVHVCGTLLVWFVMVVCILCTFVGPANVPRCFDLVYLDHDPYTLANHPPAPALVVRTLIGRPKVYPGIRGFRTVERRCQPESDSKGNVVDPVQWDSFTGTHSLRHESVVLTVSACGKFFPSLRRGTHYQRPCEVCINPSNVKQFMKQLNDAEGAAGYEVIHSD